MAFIDEFGINTAMTRRNLQAQKAPLAEPPSISRSHLSNEENVTDHASQAAVVSGIVGLSAWR
ncbi:MAG: hypothetical protein KA368_10955 [Acidobacteria bacterium]|nr:hypothetical protein [Acidobacteriota bacterium]